MEEIVKQRTGFFLVVWVNVIGKKVIVEFGWLVAEYIGETAAPVGSVVHNIPIENGTFRRLINEFEAFVAFADLLLLLFDVGNIVCYAICADGVAKFVKFVLGLRVEVPYCTIWANDTMVVIGPAGIEGGIC